MPSRKGQMATPATCWDSQELAKEAADRDMYGMDVDYESPTPRPQPQQNEEMLHDAIDAAATQGARISFSTPIWTVSAGWRDIMS